MPWRTLPNGTLKGLSDTTLDRTLSPMPRFFLTGDGHGQPPFAWINACPKLLAHFRNLMNQKKLCAHVEEFKDQVTSQSIPLELCKLYDQGHVFGWELEIYRDLLPAMNAYYQIAPVVEAAEDEDDIISLTQRILEVDRHISAAQGRLSDIGNPDALAKLGLRSSHFTSYFEGLSQKPKKPRQRALELDYATFLRQYWEEADKLRTEANPYIGANINKKIIELSERTHIITCGSAHISNNPLHSYIPLPVGAEGVVDGDDCRDLRVPKKPSIQKQSGGLLSFFTWPWKG